MIEEIKNKQCSYCKKSLPLSEFYKNKRGLYKKSSRCKKCLLEISKKYKKYYTEDYTINNLEGEKWKTIPNTDNLYEISNLGRVKSVVRKIVTKDGREYMKPQKIMAKSDNGNGYKTVMLSTTIRDKPYRAYVHRLVMEAFEGQSDLEVDHIDGDKSNNKLSNLRYCTGRENKHFYVENKKTSSDCIGVSYLSKLEKYSSSIKIGQISYSLGYFDKEYDACEAYNNALDNWKNYKKLPYDKKYHGKRDPKTTGIIKTNRSFTYRKHYFYKAYKVGSFDDMEDAIECKSLFDTIVPNELNEEVLEFIIEEFNSKYYICNQKPI